MGDLENEIRELSGRVERTRYQFLKTELQTCFTAMEMARFELSIGDLVVAQKEIGATEKGVTVIHRFLPQLPQDQRLDVEARLKELEATLKAVKAEVERALG